MEIQRFFPVVYLPHIFCLSVLHYHRKLDIGYGIKSFINFIHSTRSSTYKTLELIRLSPAYFNKSMIRLVLIIIRRLRRRYENMI